jgi:hypothetical protein
LRDLKNLRNRPFLIVNTFTRPAEGVDTSKKGWNRVTGNWDVYESVMIVDRVNDKHMRDASVIIDIMQSRVITSRFTDKSDDATVEHYLGKYMDECKKGLDVWLSKQANDFIAKEKAKKGADA